METKNEQEKDPRSEKKSLHPAFFQMVLVNPPNTADLVSNSVAK